jgi:UDP:flavonoid glycosyltransferase YjiC (YdhE family)
VAVRVLVASTPGVGHVYPMVPLARALVDAGHEVSWAVPPATVSMVEGFGMRASAAGLDRAEVMARFAAASPGFRDRFVDVDPRQRRSLVFPVTFVAVQGSAMLGDLRRVVDRWPPDVVVHDPNAVAVPVVAAARGIPRVVVGFGGLLPVDVMAAAEDGLRELWRTEDLELPPWGGRYDDLYLHPFPPSFGPPSLPATFQPMRPMGFDGVDDGQPPPWLSELGTSRKCVYVTFGTEVGAVAPYGAVAQAFADLEDVDVVLTVGREGDPDAITPRPPNVRVERYVSQRQALERASLLVSHAGSGAVLGGAARGVPQLCLPIAADQFQNTDAVVGSGCGLGLEPHQVSAEAVRDAVRQLLSIESFRARAHLVAGEIAAMPEPSQIVPRIEMLANQR